MIKINNILQPDDISCGPTCLKMVDNYINQSNITINEISEIIGTNNIKGTTLDDMIIGLTHLKINFENPILNNEDDAISYLNKSLIDGNPVILRILMLGEKHWVVSNWFDGKFYYINDPWYGVCKYNETQIIYMWKPRDFNCFKII